MIQNLKQAWSRKLIISILYRGNLWQKFQPSLDWQIVKYKYYKKHDKEKEELTSAQALLNILPKYLSLNDHTLEALKEFLGFVKRYL